MVEVQMCYSAHLHGAKSGQALPRAAAGQTLEIMARDGGFAMADGSFLGGQGLGGMGGPGSSSGDPWGGAGANAAQPQYNEAPQYVARRNPIRLFSRSGIAIRWRCAIRACLSVLGF